LISAQSGIGVSYVDGEPIFVVEHAGDHALFTLDGVKRLRFFLNLFQNVNDLAGRTINPFKFIGSSPS